MSTGTDAGLAVAARRIGTLVCFGALPVAVLATMLVVGLDTDSISADFHHELYPQTEEMLAGRNPYPPPDFDPTVAPNFIWPPAAAILVAPLTLLPLGAADLVMAAIGLACFMAALWIVGVRDWRVFGVVLLWPSVAGEMRVSHLTPIIALLLAFAWTRRHHPIRAGLYVGAATALKFFVWPVAVWLVAIRRPVAATVAAVVGALSLLLILPFTGVRDYARSLMTLGRAFDQDTYTLFGLATQLGAGDTAARAATVLAGAALVLVTLRTGSFACAVASALVLSPIVWLDYFALVAVPLAVVVPRLSAVWLLPLATWGLTGAGLGIGDALDIARLLVVFGLVVGATVWGERGREPALARPPAPHHPAS